MGRGSAPERQYHPRRRPPRLRRILAIAAVGMTVAMSVSYTQAMLAPGYAPWQDKTSSWLRDHGAGPMLNTFENWMYTRHGPVNIQPDLGALSPRSVSGASSPPGLTLPSLPAIDGVPAPHWVPGRPAAGGQPLSYTAIFQPDPDYRSVVAGVVVLPAHAIAAHVVEGTLDTPVDPTSAVIPASDVPALVAAFNSGFKLTDIDGGFYRDGTMVRPLVDGQASAIIDDTGGLRVGVWGRDTVMNQNIVAVRQNLALIVDHGAPVAGIDRNNQQAWGSARNQFQYTARSALGTTAAGDIVYLAGNNMDLPTLATALLDAGAVVGMELDIHPGMTFCSTWANTPSGQLAPTKLLATMEGPADRYLAPDRRDFFYFTATAARGAASGPGGSG